MHVPGLAGHEGQHRVADGQGAQEGVIELLLAQHPLDCPVCDKGGECPLQDQAFSHGPGESRYVEEKRHFEKPIPISDLVFLDRERCILCDRCTRFADEVAGDAADPLHPPRQRDPDQHVPRRAVRQLLQRQHRADLPRRGADGQAVPVQGPTVGSRAGREHVHHMLGRLPHRRAVEPRRAAALPGRRLRPVNWGWLCDRGRFNFEAVNSDDRCGRWCRGEGELRRTSWNAALASAAQLIRDALEAGGPERIAVLGGARGTNEDAFAWARLAHDARHRQRDAQMADGLPVGVLGCRGPPSTRRARRPTVILLGPDLKEELPVLYLRVRDAAEKRSRIIEFTPKGQRSHAATRGARVTTRPVRRRPSRAALADPDDRRPARQGPCRHRCRPGQPRRVPAVGHGRPARCRRAVPRGEGAAGAAPGQRRRRPPGRPASRRGRPRRRGILTAAADGKIECLVLLGADPLGRLPRHRPGPPGDGRRRRIIAVDTFLTESAAAGRRRPGGRRLRREVGHDHQHRRPGHPVAQKVTAHGTARPDWMIAAEIAEPLGTRPATRAPRSTTSPTRSPPRRRLRGRHPRRAGQRHRRRARGPGADSTAVRRRRGHRAADRNGYDYRLVVSRKLYDPAVGTAMSPSLAPLPARRGRTCIRSMSRASA